MAKKAYSAFNFFFKDLGKLLISSKDRADFCQIHSDNCIALKAGSFHEIMRALRSLKDNFLMSLKVFTQQNYKQNRQ
jgi:hypothetical protein